MADRTEDLSSREDRMRRRKALTCAYCRPHRNENASRKGKHGARPPREKNRRK